MEFRSIGMYDPGSTNIAVKKKYFESLRVLCGQFFFASELHYFIKLLRDASLPKPPLGANQGHVLWEWIFTICENGENGVFGLFRHPQTNP